MKPISLKTTEEVLHKIEELSNKIVEMKQRLSLDNNPYMSKLIKNEIKSTEIQLNTLKWVVSPRAERNEFCGFLNK